MALIFDLGFGCSGGGGVTPTGTISITENGTYNVTNYASADVNVAGSGGKYQLLQRISDDNGNEIGTVSGFFTDANDVEYAVVCLDAQYRQRSLQWCSSNSLVTNMPIYNNLGAVNLWNQKETATQNTQLILDFCSAQSLTSSACTHCRNSSFILEGVTYYGQLPNIPEIIDIAKNYADINEQDSTADSYPDVSFASRKTIMSSNQYDATQFIRLYYTALTGTTNKNSTDSIVTPVLELPN